MRNRRLIILIGLAFASCVSARADDISGRSAFYDATPITETSLPSLLTAVAADIPVLKAKGVVFTPVSDTALPYPQAGFEIDFAHSKFTPETEALAQRWQRVRNYLAIRGQFQKCGLTTDARQLDTRILAIAGQVKLPDMNCQALMNEADPQVRNLAKINNAFLSSQIEDLVITKALQSAGTAYGYASKRYPGAVSNDLCGSGSITLTGKSYAWQECSGAVTDTLSQAIKQGQAGVTPITTDQLRDELNTRINSVNHYLGLVQAPMLNGKPNPNAQTLQQYNTYELAYGTATSAADGDLLLTDPAQSEMGALRTLDKGGGPQAISTDLSPIGDGVMATTINYSSMATWPSHGAVDEKGVTKAIQEDRDDLRYQMSMLNDMYIDKKNVEGYNPGNATYRGASQNMDDLKTLVKNNPLAVGQALMEFPQAAATICSVISQIEKDDVNTRSRDKHFAVGLAVVGGLLVATGFGAAFGAWALGGSAAIAAGAAVTATAAEVSLGATVGTLVTVGTLAGTAGFVVGMGSTAYYGTRMVQTSSDLQNLQDAMLAHSGDAQTQKDVAAAMNTYMEMRRGAIISGVGTALDLGALNYLLKIGSASTDLTLMSQYLNDSQIALKSGTNVAGALAKVGSAMGDTPEDVSNTAKLLNFFANGSEKMRVQLLIKLSKMGPEQIRTALAQALKQAVKCAPL